MITFKDSSCSFFRYFLGRFSRIFFRNFSNDSIKIISSRILQEISQGIPPDFTLSKLLQGFVERGIPRFIQRFYSKNFSRDFSSDFSRKTSAEILPGISPRITTGVFAGTSSEFSRAFFCYSSRSSSRNPFSDYSRKFTELPQELSAISQNKSLQEFLNIFCAWIH